MKKEVIFKVFKGLKKPLCDNNFHILLPFIPVDNS